MATGKETKKKRSLPRKETKQEKSEEKNIDTANNNIAAEEVVSAEIEPKEVQIKAEKTGEERISWVPKTELGRKVLSKEITDIMQIFSEGEKIMEPEIVDMLLPQIESEIIMIGGSTGKGGGIRRTPSKRTARMHKSGRRYNISAMVVIGNGNGFVGLGFVAGPPAKHRELMEKALQNAKLNLIPVRRGCGSWECFCAKPHSIPVAVSGKSGSVIVELKPAPKGIGLCVSDEVKKIMRMAGIRDIWSKTRGQTQSRINLIKAVFYALKKLNTIKILESQHKPLGLA